MGRFRQLLAGTVALTLCAWSGGLALAQSDAAVEEATPAAAVEYAPPPSIDPSLVPDADGFIFEDVEPGIRRLVTDGAGHFPSATYIREARDMDELAVDEQGRVLVWSTTHGIDNELGGDAQLWILGEDGVLDPDEGAPRPSEETGAWGGSATQLAPDGRTWSLDRGYDGSGVIRSDGETAERFLANRFLNSLAVTPDGRAWVAEGHDPGEAGGIYVIEPDAEGEPVDAAAVTTIAPPAAETGTLGLAWSKAFDVPAPFVVESIVEAHDRFYALANDHAAGYYSPSMLLMSEEGTDWVELDVAGLLSDGASVRRLAGSEHGLLAFGFRPSPEGYSATAWSSLDGAAWDARDLGYVVEPASQPFTTNMLDFSAAALGSSGAVASAIAFPGFDWTAAQSAAASLLPSELAAVDPDRVGVTHSSAQITVGPFVVYSESLESLGLGEIAEAQRFTNSPSAAGPERRMTFHTDDLEAWSATDGSPMDAEYVMAIVPTDGGYVAAAFDRSGTSDVLVSADGQTWESTGWNMDGMSGLFTMGDRLLTEGWQGPQRVTLVSDDAGRTWEDVGGPDVSGSWIAAAGPAGILATGTEGEVGWGATPEPGVVERDGYTVTFDGAHQDFAVADPNGAEVFSSALQMDDPMWGWEYTAPDDLAFDFDDETASVSDPSTGETLVTLTFADLDQFGASMVDYGGELLLFSPDAERWTVSTLDEAFGPDRMLGASVVGTDRVVAAVGRGYPDPSRDQSIWVGLPVSGTAMPTTAAPTGNESAALPEAVMDGPALAWERVLDLEDHRLATMLATDLGLWAIGEDDGRPSTLWHSADGATWTRLDTDGLFGEGAVVSGVAEGGPGLLAVGSAPSGDGQEAVAWTSADGQKWTMSSLGRTMPEPEQPFELSELGIRAMATGPEGAVVAATPRTGLDFSLLEPSVAAALPAGLRDYATGMGVMIDPSRIGVSVGPFEVLSASVSDLDVDQDLFAAYGRAVSGGMEDSLFFVTDDYTSWQQVDEWAGGGEPPMTIVATGDGYLAATSGWGDSTLYTSADGLAWEETELPAGAKMVHWFGADGERLLMAGWQDGKIVVWGSDDDGDTWTARAALPADTWDVRTGGFGLVATGEHPSEWWDRSQWTTVVEQDGLTLSIEQGQDGLVLTGADGETLLTAGVFGAGDGPESLALPSVITADHERGVFTVSDPDSGDALMTITYREMQDAFELAQGPAGRGPDTLVAYSEDGQAWSEQSLIDLLGRPVGSAPWRSVTTSR